MKIDRKIKYFTLIQLFIHIIAIHCLPEKSIVIVIPSFNNKDWYKQNLDSVFTQNYQNYQVIYIDDCSTDGTGNLVRQYVTEHNLENKISIFSNNRRRSALPNLFNAIHSCNDTDIIAILDGDDWFAHENVLSYFNEIYKDPNVWITYGTYKDLAVDYDNFYGSDLSFDWVKNNFLENEVRAAFTPGHIKTFYASLFKKIKLSDLFYEGKFAPSSYDIAINIPLFGMGKDHIKWIPEITCIHNLLNHLNDSKVDSTLQYSVHVTLQKTIPPYEKCSTKENVTNTSMIDTDCILFATNYGFNLDIIIDSIRHYISGLKQIYIISDKIAQTSDNNIKYVLASSNEITTWLDELKVKETKKLLLMSDNLIVTKSIDLNEALKECQLMQAAALCCINQTNNIDNSFIEFPVEEIGLSTKYFVYQTKAAKGFWKKLLYPRMMVIDKNYFISSIKDNKFFSLMDLMEQLKTIELNNNDIVIVY